MLPYSLKHHSRRDGTYGRGRRANGLIVRAVVLKTFLPDDPQLFGNRTAKLYAGVTCDVLVYEPRNRVVLKNVPISPQSAGLNDHEVWLPEPSTFDTSTGNTYNIAYLVGLPISKVSDMDGDHVRIEFMGGDLQQPIITGQIPHPKTNRRPTIANETKFKYQRFLRGMSFGVTDDGDVRLDLSTPTTKPSEGGILPNGTEVPNVMGGNLLLMMQPNALIELQDSAASATEFVARGETLLSDLKASLTELSSVINGLGIPTPMTVTLLTKITTSLSAGLPYLSKHIKVD